MSQRDNVAANRNSQFLFTVSLTPAATAAASAVEQAFTVTSSLPQRAGGLKSTDHVAVTGPGSGNSVTPGHARVNSSGQLVIQFVNPTAGSLTHAAGPFTVLVTRN